MIVEKFNEQLVRQCYQFLKHGTCTEVRLIDPVKKQKPRSIFVLNEDAFVEACKAANGSMNVYVGINERVMAGTEAKDVISVRTLVLDIDAVRSPGYQKEPATSDELLKAKTIAYKIVADVRKAEQPEPVIVCSGNGYQLWFAIPEIPIDDDNRKDVESKIQIFQDIMIQRYGEQDCIDKIGDLPRIIKVWGTLNIKSEKGTESAERPFRVAVLENSPERNVNTSLGKKILELSTLKEPLVPIVNQITEINKEYLPRPISFLLYDYQHTAPNGWMRIVEVFASFFRGIGLVKEQALGHIIEWSRRQKYREQNEEHEIKEIVDRIYKNGIMCPNFDKLVFKDEGYPFFGLRSKFNNVDLGKDWERYVNPIVYYNAKMKASTQDLKAKVLSLLARAKRGDINEATELITQDFLLNFKFYSTKEDQKSELWIYHEGIYVPNGRSFVKEYMRTLLQEAYTIFLVNEVIAKIEASVYITTDAFFGTSYVEDIPVLNGILNVRTRALIPFTPEKIFFNKLPVAYDPLSQCAAIDSFLKEVFADASDREVFYELAGFSLLKEYRFEKAFMLVGNGRNGKGKSLELLKRLVGMDNCCSLTLQSFDVKSFQISELFRKLLNLAGDISNDDLKDTSMFKSLTGRDIVNAKRKFLNDIKFQNYAKFVFACNELPAVYDMSRGFWDRWVLLEYPYTFVPLDEYNQIPEKERGLYKIRNETIIDDITKPAELSGLLNKALDGLDRLIKQGKFSATKGTQDIKDTWIRRANSFVSFAYENLEEGYDNHISKKELRKKYSTFCKQHKISVKSDFVIKKILQEMFGAGEGRIKDTRDMFAELVHIWEGVKWKI